MPLEPLTAEVKARVPDSWQQALETEAAAQSQGGMRVNPSDILRTALHEFFQRRKIKVGRNGKEAHA